MVADAEKTSEISPDRDGAVSEHANDEIEVVLDYVGMNPSQKLEAEIMGRPIIGPYPKVKLSRALLRKALETKCINIYDGRIRLTCDHWDENNVMNAAEYIQKKMEYTERKKKEEAEKQRYADKMREYAERLTSELGIGAYIENNFLVYCNNSIYLPDSNEEEIKNWLMRKKKEDEELTERKEREMREEQEKRSFAEDWLREHAPEHVERFLDGYMPIEEVQHIMRDEVFKDSPLPTYTRMTDDELPHEDYCEPEDDVLWSIEDNCMLSQDQYRRLQALRQAYPGTDIVPRLHIGECETCGAQVKRVGACVSMRLGPYVLSREFFLD